MATLGPYYCTGSSYCQNRMEYSIERTADGYKVTYNIAFYRTNSYTTSGRTYWGIYIDGNLYQSGNQSISFSNSGWVTLASGSFTVSLSGWSSTNITLGYETCSSVTTNLTTGGYTHDYLSGSPDHTTSVGINAYYSVCGVPSVNITDNGNNTFTISATAGYSGNNNTANGVTSVEYSFNNYDWYGTSNWGAISISSNQTVYGRAKTDGSYADSDYGYATPISVKYYSKPGKPTVTISDNGSGTVSISATKGSNGSNNNATGVSDVQYSFDNSTWINYSSPFTITESQTVYARARTKGTYTGNSNAYLYSDYTVVSSSVTAITKCSKPDLSLSSSILRFNSNNLILFISATSGVNNNITGYEIQYSGSDTLTFTNWSASLSLSTSEDIYDYEFARVTSYFNTLKSLNKKYICFRVKTIGSVSGYDSDYNYISIMTDKGYPRVKNSDGTYGTCIPYVLKDGIWSQCVLNSGVLSKLKDNSGEYILDSNGENIYTLEDSSVILNS